MSGRAASATGWQNVKDWAISRNRYWGTPIPIWRCECGHVECIGSRAELAERAQEDIDENIELHRPYVDDVHLTCPVCGKTMTRIPEVMDCWFDSGSMPFAQLHYPFENQDVFEENSRRTLSVKESIRPADGSTRCWRFPPSSREKPRTGMSSSTT